MHERLRSFKWLYWIWKKKKKLEDCCLYTGTLSICNYILFYMHPLASLFFPYFHMYAVPFLSFSLYFLVLHHLAPPHPHSAWPSHPYEQIPQESLCDVTVVVWSYWLFSSTSSFLWTNKRCNIKLFNIYHYWYPMSHYVHLRRPVIIFIIIYNPRLWSNKNYEEPKGF